MQPLNSRLTLCGLQVNGSNDQDFCQFEFNYATHRKGTKGITTVVLEESMKDTCQWEGVIGGDLGGDIYTPGWDDHALKETIDSIFEQLCCRVDGLRERCRCTQPLQTPNVAYSPTSLAEKHCGRYVQQHLLLPLAQYQVIVNLNRRSILQATRLPSAGLWQQQGLS